MTSPEPQPWVVDEDGRRLLEAAETAFEEAVAASDAVRAALTARRRPHDTDLRLLSEAASAFDRLRAALPKDADLPPSATLADIRAVLDELASARRDAALIRRLTAVTGPPQVEDVLAEVRAAAADGQPRELSVLTLLIEAAGADEVDVDEVDALSEKAHEKLPDHWSKVISFAARGRLSLSPVPASTADDTTAEPVASASPAQGAAKTSDSSEQDLSPRPVPAELAPDAATTFAPPAEAEPMPTSSADTDGADETVIPDGGATARGLPEKETDDLAPLLIADARHREAASARESGGADDDARTVPERQPHPAPEPAVHKTVDGSGAESADDEADRGRQAEAAALQSERLALAGWVRLACGAPEAQARARWAAALAREIYTSGGRLWPAYIEMVRGLDADALGDDTAGRLLVWASAIRAGIIRPSDESTEMLRQHAPVVAAHQGLAELGEKFLNAAAVGTHLVPGVSNKLSGAQPEEWRQEMVERARTMLADGPRKTIKYSTATEVWKHLLQEDGEIGRLLAFAAADAESRAREAEEQVERLRADGAIDRLIDTTTRELRRHRSRRRIEAAARRRLIQLIEEALDIVHGWSRAVREALDVRGAKPEHLAMRQRLAALQAEAFPLRKACMRELRALKNDASDPVLEAAAHVARTLVEETLNLLKGAQLAAKERTPDQVMAQELLLAPGIALEPGTCRPLDTPDLKDLEPLCQGGLPDWTDAFNERAHNHDHVGTEAIVTVLRDIDPAQAAELEQRRDMLKEEARRELHGLREKIGDKLAQMRRDGQLDERAVTRLQTRLRQLNDNDRNDLDRLRKVAESVSAEADEIAARQVAKVRAELDAYASQPSVAAAADQIREYLDRGDLTTARESLVQARQGHELPAPSRERGNLTRFFPAFPDAFAALGPSRDNRLFSEAINVLINALENGGRLDNEPLRRALADGGLDLTALRRPGVSREGLRKWRTVAQGPKPAGNLLTAIEPVLRLIGLEATARADATEHNRKRTWIELTEVRWRGQALLPQFGTGMSPSGDTLRLLLVWDCGTPQQIVERFKDEPTDQTVLVWYFGTLSAADRRRLVQAVRSRPHPVAVLDDAAVGYLACLPECDWADTVEVLAPFTSINPFIPTGHVPDEMFYGRQEQLRQVIDRTGGSFVYGGRQLGKSALLQAARRRADRDPRRIVIFKSISEVGRTAPADAIWAVLRRPLADVGVLSPAQTGGDAEEIREAIRSWLADDSQRQLLILLDEADEFLNRDADSARFANVSALRDLMNETDRRVKVVFAGLHQTARFKNLSNQPLAHLGEPISIGPLKPQDAFDLLTKPLATLGFRMPERLAARVIAEANNAPALIQLFADALLKHLQQRTAEEHPLPYEVTRDDVDAVRRDARLAEGFRERFDWTINLDQRYKVIAYAVALNALSETADSAIPAGDLFNDCRQWWPRGFAQCTRDEFQGLLDESVELGVLLAEDGRYRLRTPYILDLLGGQAAVEESLDRAEEFELPDSFDVHSYRSAYQSGPQRSERSPLTSGQVSRLLSASNNIHVLAGSAALRLEHVPKALRAEEDRNPHVKVHLVRKGDPIGSLAAKARRHRGPTLIIVDLRERTVEQAAKQIREASKVVARHYEGTLGVVFSAPPSLAPLWLAARASSPIDPALDLDGNAELMELRRFDPPSIRQWMREEAHAFQTPHRQQNLLEATGGWPMLIGEVLHAGIVADPDAALEGCHRRLREAPHRLVAASGVHCHPPVRAAWQALVDIDEPGDPADLAELLDPGDAPGHPLSTEVLRRHHYRSVADVIEVLRILGALVPASGSEHELVCEPVLARATRMAGEQA